MSANSAQTGRSVKPTCPSRTAFLLIFIIAAICLIIVGVLTKQLNTDHQGQAGFGTTDAFQTTAAADPSAATSLLRPAASTIALTLLALLKELGKQAIDQPGHFLIAALPIVLSRHFTGVPWYGWPVIPLLAYREWLQWPSNRWWDPPLDWAVLALGVIMATWAIRSLPRARRPVAGAPAAPLWRPRHFP